MNKKENENSRDLGFEKKLFAIADKLRSNMDAAEYKHVVLGLIFLKYISDASYSLHKRLLNQAKDGFDPENPSEYRNESVFWVPPKSRWDYIEKHSTNPEIGKLIDEAMVNIEIENSTLKGVLTKDYARPSLNKRVLGSLIDMIGSIRIDNKRDTDILGRVYEYFLGEFAAAEGKKGGQFYTPQCVVKTLVSMIEPYQGTIFDPCCGSGGLFVQSKEFMVKHQGKTKDNLSIFGQESNQTTWRLCKMNLAIRKIESNIQCGDSFHDDHFRDLKADYILANPPFNAKDWKSKALEDDPRWNQFGIQINPPEKNANYAWILHFLYHLSSEGYAGFVLANGSLSSSTPKEEPQIREKLIKNDLIDCIVTLPPNLFYNTTIPACIWIISRTKHQTSRFRNRQGEILFIDARNLGTMVDRSHRILTDENIEKISKSYH
ncbi:MAG: N-6 DNA methylase, partial [Candidatus Hodarchaeota archaeon]